MGRKTTQAATTITRQVEIRSHQFTRKPLQNLFSVPLLQEKNEEQDQEQDQLINKELPSFVNRMCYIIKSKQSFNFYSMTVAIEKKNVDIDRLKVWLISNYDL